MSKLIMMCGLPASGKTTLAKELAAKHSTVVLSSDEIRNELFNDITDQSDNRWVFETMNSRAKAQLDDGKNVVYDATNISRKRRMHLINHVLRADEKIIYYMDISYPKCVLNNHTRRDSVGHSVIEKMYKNMQIPVKNEGWDNVIIMSDLTSRSSWIRGDFEQLILKNPNHDELFDGINKSLYELKEVKNMPQDNKYHSFSVSRHTYYVLEYLFDNNASLKLLYAGLFHDIGKHFCKSFTNYKGETSRYANFIGHENVGSQITMYRLNQLGYDDQFVKDVSALIQFHMYPMSAGEKKMKDVRRLLGDELYDDLMLLHEADLQAK